MLIGLINRHIKPYWPQLVLIVILQAGAQVAALTLPTINANIIDNGVVTLDTHYVKTHSAVMLGVAAVLTIWLPRFSRPGHRPKKYDAQGQRIDA